MTSTQNRQFAQSSNHFESKNKKRKSASEDLNAEWESLRKYSESPTKMARINKENDLLRQLRGLSVTLSPELSTETRSCSNRRSIIIDSSSIDTFTSTSFRVVGSNSEKDEITCTGFTKSVTEVIEIADEDDDHDIIQIDEEPEVEFISARCLESRQYPSLIPGLKSNRTPDRTSLDEYVYKGCTCKSGYNVQFQDNTFMRIETIFRDEATDTVYLRGKHLVRPDCRDSSMQYQRNELIWYVRSPESPNENHSASELVERSVLGVVRNRNVIFTNQSYSKLSYRNIKKIEPQHKEMSALFCRWKQTTKGNGRRSEISFEHLLSHQADTVPLEMQDKTIQIARINNKTSRYLWRRDLTCLGGSNEKEFDIILPDGRVQRKMKRTYTFGDCFCGAGGTSQGALNAGLKIIFAFDMDEQAIETYRANFLVKGVRCIQKMVYDFICDSNAYLMVDILHISPPCQPFSACHTKEGKNDEANQAALPSVHQLIEKIRPRIVTLEETEGLLSRHRTWFSALRNIFLDLGYSVRWKCLPCQAYGVPQTRLRLVIIAAGPGERLPPFPPETHGEDNQNLKSLVTIGDAIRNLPASEDDNHVAEHHQKPSIMKTPRVPFSENVLAKTITTRGGAHNYHPSGQRLFNVRELANMQTFPAHFTFQGARGLTAARRQVGNAVPPIMAKAIFRSIIKSLQESDEQELKG